MDLFRTYLSNASKMTFARSFVPVTDLFLVVGEGLARWLSTDSTGSKLDYWWDVVAFHGFLNDSKYLDWTTCHDLHGNSMTQNMGVPWISWACVTCVLEAMRLSSGLDRSWRKSRRLGESLWLFGGFHGHGGTPQWLVFNGKSNGKMDDVGLPRFMETTI